MIPRLEQLWKSSPAVRLATAYVAILMLISLLFSVALYHFAERELTDSLRRQYTRIYEFGGINRPFSPLQIQAEMEAARARLVLELAYFNLIILIFGSAVSYALAKRTVRPIEEALATQSRFTADASHELRTPLAAMQTEIEVAKRDPKLSKQDAMKLLDSNLEEVVKLRTLADGLLRLARNKDREAVMEEVSLKELVERSVKKLSTIAKEKGIPIKSSLKEDVRVWGESQSLADLLVILLDNAVKYSAKGKPVRVSLKIQRKQALIKVQDEGRGIAKADLPRIFDRFYRADASRTKADVEGHGLGLSIARQIAVNHGGTLEVASVHGKGSTFTLTLPVMR